MLPSRGSTCAVFVGAELWFPSRGSVCAVFVSAGLWFPSRGSMCAVFVGAGERIDPIFGCHVYHLCVCVSMHRRTHECRSLSEQVEFVGEHQLSFSIFLSF